MKILNSEVTIKIIQCEGIYKSGKKKGQACSNKAKWLINGKKYCGIHGRSMSRISLNESDKKGEGISKFKNRKSSERVSPEREEKIKKMEKKLKIVFQGSDVYIPEEDDLTYDFLIKEGVVKNKKGESDVKRVTLEDLKSVSVLGVSSVLDGDYAFDVVKSNTQKMFRRYKEKKFLRSLLSIANMGGQFLSNIINRVFKVFLSEDVGPSHMEMSIICWDFIKYYNGVKKVKDIHKKKEFRNKLIQYAITLFRSYRSRLVDNSLCHINMGKKLDKLSGDFDTLLDMFFKNEENNNMEEGVKLIMAMSYVKKNDKRGKINKGTKINDKLFSRKRKKIYYVWKYILDESKKVKNEDDRDILYESNLALLKIYDSYSSFILNIIHAYMNLKLVQDSTINDLKRVKLVKLNDEYN